MAGKQTTLKKLVFSLVSLCFALGLGEVTIRALSLAPEVFLVREGRFRLAENPLIGYEMVPDYASEVSGPMHDFAGRSNNLGFRDRDHQMTKPDTDRRRPIASVKHDKEQDCGGPKHSGHQ